MAYLVTGGTGYIGSYVVRDLLKEGKEVVCLQRSGLTPVYREIVGEGNLDKVRIIKGDVSNTLQLFEVIRRYCIDLIIHIGFSIPPTSEQQPAYALQVNCIGMNNLLEAARLFGLRRVIWTSSIQAFGRLGSFYKELVGEDDAIYMPDSMYGATKALNEFMTKLYFEKFGVDSIGFRLPRTYGIGRYHGFIGVFTEIMRKGALNYPVTIEEPNYTTAYLYVEDAADLIVTACYAPTTKIRVFNVIEGNYTNRQLVETIRKINPHTQVTLKEGKFEGFHPPRLDATGVQTELGWQPKYSLEEGIRKVFNYFRQKEGLPLL